MIMDGSGNSAMNCQLTYKPHCNIQLLIVIVEYNAKVQFEDGTKKT